jgi:hypothetical protein
MTQQTPSTSTTSNSPLSEAATDSLNELMERDPLELTKQDIGLIVSSLRRQRVAWEQEETTAKSKGKRPSAAAAKAAAKQLTLDSLDIEL